MDKEMRYSKMCNNEKPQKHFFSRQNGLFSADGDVDDDNDEDVIFSIFRQIKSSCSLP